MAIAEVCWGGTPPWKAMGYFGVIIRNSPNRLCLNAVLVGKRLVTESPASVLVKWRNIIHSFEQKVVVAAAKIFFLNECVTNKNKPTINTLGLGITSC